MHEPKEIPKIHITVVRHFSTNIAFITEQTDNSSSKTTTFNKP